MNCILFVLVVVFCIGMLTPVFAEGSIEHTTSVDNEDFNLVLLIDRSGSMNKTDTKGFVKDAAKLFVDLCEESGNSQITVMSFNTAINNSGFMNVGSEGANRDYIKEQISAINYAPGGTDIGFALQSAVDYLHANRQDDKNNLIVMFTDGYTEDLIRKDDFKDKSGKVDENAFEKARQEALGKSEEHLQNALKTASEDDCRIFMIGANYKNSMKEEGKKALESIRDKQIANGVTTPPDELLTIIDSENQDSMSQVVNAFEKIYASIGNRIIHSGDIVIESPNVTEVNVIITAPDGISRAEVTSPLSNSISLDLEGRESLLDDARIIYKEGDSYQLIKIIAPIAIGTWQVNVTDKQENPILDYTWMLTSSTEIAMDLVQDKGIAYVSVSLVNVDSEAAPNYFHSLIEKQLTVEDPSGNTMRQELQFDPSENCLKAHFRIDTEGEYIVTAYVTDGYFSRTCVGRTSLSSYDKDFGDITLWNWLSTTKDISDLVGTEITVCQEVIGGESIASFELNGTKLTVKGLHHGTEALRVQCLTPDGAEIELTGTLTVRNSLLVVFIAIGVLLAIVAYFIIRSFRRLRGTLKNVQVTLNGVGQVVPEVFVPRHRKFSLYDLLKEYNKDVVSTSWQQTVDDQLLNPKTAFSKELKKQKIVVRRDKRSFVFEHNVYKIQESNVFWSSSDANLTINFDY